MKPPLSLRTTPALRSWIVEAAQLAGRSLAEEAQICLANRYSRSVLQITPGGRAHVYNDSGLICGLRRRSNPRSLWWAYDVNTVTCRRCLRELERRRVRAEWLAYRRQWGG